MKMVENLIAQVYKIGASGQKLVTIPKNSKIEAGEYIVYKKLKLPNNLGQEKIQKIISIIEGSDIISFATKDGEVIPII